MQLQEFLKKFYELRDTSPRLFSQSRDNENCLYTEDIAYSKNAYYVFAGGWVEDSYYGELLIKCKDCVDCTKVEDSELCYECVDCYQCYNSDFLSHCRSTRDSKYCYGLRDCEYCFLSNNLHHKSFFFKNKPYHKDEYLMLVREYKNTHSSNELYKEFLDLIQTSIHVNLNLINTENCVGDDISDSKNVYHGFDILHAEDFLYCEEGGYGRDYCDTYFTGEGELNYECVNISKHAYNCSFCVDCVTCMNCEFCMTCYDCQDSFGCFYLKGKRHYILNKPHEPEEYKKEVGNLKKALIESGNYSLKLFT